MAEVERRLNEWDRRMSGHVSRELYERDRQEIKEDIAEIRGSITWALRLVVAQFLALVITLVMFVVGRA